MPQREQLALIGESDNQKHFTSEVWGLLTFFPTKRGRASPASVYTGCTSYLRRQILQENCIYRGAKDHSQLTVCA